jgi:hypothetical protein
MLVSCMKFSFFAIHNCSQYTGVECDEFFINPSKDERNHTVENVVVTGLSTLFWLRFYDKHSQFVESDSQTRFDANFAAASSPILNICSFARETLEPVGS